MAVWTKMKSKAVANDDLACLHVELYNAIFANCADFNHA